MIPTPAQQQAINSNETDILCVAGPGSGKTQTTVDRIKRLIETSTPPARIVALTFTNAAAKELEERLQSDWPCLPDGSAISDNAQMATYHLGYTGTLHGFAFRCLREHGALLGYGTHLTVISPESAQDLLEQKAKELGCRDTIKRLLEIKAAGLDTTKRMTVAETTVASFLQELKQASIVDFDILLTEFARLVREHPECLAGRWDHLFVDEVQDSSTTDWQIYRGLPIPSKFYGGDPDQSIYGFRGAAVAEMVAHAQAAKVITLESNFRSLEPICRAAQALIEYNAGRIPKATISTRGIGPPVRLLPP
ncbi:MAG: ATP-dependent helicase, partial [Polyangia bacterium]